VFDYGWPIANGAWAIALPAVPIVGLVVATVWAVARGAAVGFLGAWFFLTLAPSSSVIPIKDLAFEHRMYLPLAAVAVLCVVAMDTLLRRWDTLSSPVRHRVAAALLAVVVLSLGVATARRNRVYRSEVSIWRDVLAKRPENPRGYYALGGALVAAGQDERAIPFLEEALRRQPMNALARCNLGVAELRLGRTESAVATFDQVLRVDPAMGRGAFMRGLIGRAYYNRGVALDALGRYPEAITSYREARQFLPGDPTIPVELRIAEALLARIDKEIARFFLALRQEQGPPGVLFEELPGKTQPPPGTFDQTYAHIVGGRPVGQVRVSIDLTQDDAHVRFAVGGDVPGYVVKDLSQRLSAVMAQSGAEPVPGAGR
jgi:Flp pilus assembly protein TadD